MTILIKISALDSAGTGSVTGVVLPGGMISVIPFVWSWIPSPIVIYAASTEGWSTGPNDTPPNTHIAAKFDGALTWNRFLYNGIDPTDNLGSMSFGDITFTDDGPLDFLARLMWDGATIDVLRGVQYADPATFTLVARLSSDSLIYDLEKKTIALRNLKWQMELAPLHNIRYKGTGDYEGDASLKDQLRYLVIGGSVTNIPLRRLTNNYTIYEASCSSIHSFDAVFDGGGLLTPSGVNWPDFASLKAALVAVSIPAGKYDTCLALGILATGSEPVMKALTANVTGDADIINGFGQPITRAQIVRRIATGRGNYTLKADQIDEPSFAALDVLQPAPCGYFFDQAITKHAAIDRVMKGCLGWWSIGLLGQLKVGLVTALLPSSGSVSVPIDGQALVGFKIVGLPRTIATAIPRQATYIGYAYNYTIQEESALLTSVSPTDRSRLREQCPFAPSVDEGYALNHPTAPTVTIEESGYVFAVDAQIEADREQDIFKRFQERWSIDVEVDSFLDVLGQAWDVLNVNRYTFGPLRPMLVVATSVSTSGEDTATWELVG